MIYKMQIATLAEENLLWDDFSHRFGWLRERGFVLQINREVCPNSNTLLLDLVIEGDNNDLFMKDEDIVYIFKHQISEFLAEHILHDWENKMVRREISKRTRHLNGEELKIVWHKAMDFLQRCNTNDSINLLFNYGRKNKISHKIMDHIYHYDKLVIEGLINFGMQDYWNELRFAVDLACEELNNEKEYNDFVRLLRYFVDTQTPRMPEVNLRMDQDGLFFLWDGNGADIDEKIINYYSNELLYNDISLDDILVSILITISPRRIILHNSNSDNSEPVKVIRQVFGERIKDCGGCERCRQHQEGERNKSN
ncbi:MAG TPA: putative sporulation protein YtxC [Syntrophomonas sp.]|nr:putative sporulation protein YtxC [Syntrophomonas sp.]HRW12011.1 putative sporulation protein YtxC [Syntrophomonas sp.]